MRKGLPSTADKLLASQSSACRNEKLILYPNLFFPSLSLITSANLKEFSNNLLEPNLYCTVRPGCRNGLRVAMLITPLKALGPKYAELAPCIISTFIMSSSEAPRKLPREKLRPGA